MILLTVILQTLPVPPFSRITDWQPFPIQRTPEGGFYDRASATRRGDVVTAWVRFVNVELKGLNTAAQQTDAHMEADCRTPRMRMMAYRVVRPDGSTLQLRKAPPGEMEWHEMRLGMRGYDVVAGLCSRIGKSLPTGR
ncbi:hypothetical protein [Sphingomonas melonis]|uniref:Uncharacterized protein n=1 Tax=Sphingomonas melonis TaxID=152682 RepID=A0A7Y9FKI5_9SPHN|nr:hypothetical protein [Sphingomonas melonis]NYD89020.1 hypothetical protein [Sphingomonas melonis]